MEEDKRINDIHYYLGLVKKAIDNGQTFTHIVTATKLPSGAVEVAVNTDHIPEKIDYILSHYDDETMQHINNAKVILKNVMII